MVSLAVDGNLIVDRGAIGGFAEGRSGASSLFAEGVLVLLAGSAMGRDFASARDRS